MAYQTRQFVFRCPSRRESPWHLLNMTAMCYRASNNSPVDGLTLFFFHCNSTHKEQWEPIIEHLFSQSRSSHFKIREAWAFDSPSHGEAAVLNQFELLEKHNEVVSVSDWVPGVVQFLRSNYMQGHRVVLCGHSIGATVTVLAALEFYPNVASAGIIGMIIIESTMMTIKATEGKFEAIVSRMEILSSSKRDSWTSREEALQYFQNKRPWNRWDPRMLHLYTDHGLYEHPDGTVTLKCDKKREVNLYEDWDPHTSAFASLGKLCHIMPIHAIWGERKDYIPDFVRATHSDGSEGRLMASVTSVEQAGHMVVQEQPIRLAQAIYHILEKMPYVSVERSKL